jgi:hypothetical protein
MAYNFVFRISSILLFTFLYCEFGFSKEIDTYFLNPGPNTSYSLKLKESVLRLALEKTKSEYGDYKIMYTSPMSSSRARIELSKGNIKNLVLLTTYSDIHSDKNIEYVRFPVDLGLTGKRICFTGDSFFNQSTKPVIFEDFKSFRFIQGIGSVDTQILRDAGLNVVEVANEDSIYQLLALGRADFYCRGINEIQAEYKINKIINGLHVDDSFVFVYDLPRLFYLNIHDNNANKRIDFGLRKAYKDGSLEKLLNGITFGNDYLLDLAKRRCFRLENRFLKNIDFKFKDSYIKIATQCD